MWIKSIIVLFFSFLVFVSSAQNQLIQHIKSLNLFFSNMLKILT